MSLAFLPPQLEILVRTWETNPTLLARLIAAMWEKPSIEWLAMRVKRGALEAYETWEGLILLETVDWTHGRELSIYGMVGRGILNPKNAEAIVRDLKAIAAHKACRMIGGVGVPVAWRRAAPRLGFLPVSTHYVMELADGRE